MSSPTSTASGSDGPPLVRRLRVLANAADLALYRRTRALARTPDIVRWVRRYSRLGEHGAVWLAVGALRDRAGRVAPRALDAAPRSWSAPPT